MKKVLLCILLLCTSIAAISQNPILLKDVYPGITGSGIQQIVKTNNYIFFNAEDDDADTDRGLYRTDGSTSGTVQLNLTYPGYASTKADKLTALGNQIIFAGNNFPNNGEIWASDGTQAGTVALERLQPNSNRIPVVEINAMGSYAYYSVINKDASNVNRAYLKRTDGTAAGTSLVYDFSAFTGVPQVVFLTPVNNILYFIVYDQFGTGFDQLWRSDGTTAGTYMVYNFGPNQYVASYLMVAGDNMYVMIVTPGTGNVLWKSDGTAVGTVPVKTIAASGNNNYPPFAAIGSTLYFAGLDGNGKELWKTDGTNGGTILVSDINAGAANSNPASMVVFNNTLYFSATTATEGNELWKFDGTTASLVKDIYPGTSSGNPFGFVISNNTMLFRATGDIAGPELWITDGTSINTRLVKDINPTGSSAPSLLTAINNTVYFTANNGIAGQELYKYDNTEGIAGLNKVYVNDNSQTSDVFTTAIGDNANMGTRTSPVATVTYALSIAQPGDTIYIDAGSYTEIVDVTKDITLRGAGMGITILNGPAGPVTPFAGTFETGIIQSIAGVTNVIIENMTIDGAVSDESHGTFIQGGGRISNCELRYVNDGFYFQYISNEQRTVVGNNNYVHHVNYVGALFAGNGLSVTASNNVIDLTDAIGGMGFIAGYGGTGNVASFTASNNKIIGFKNFGILVGSIQTAQINNNSLTRIAGNYIQNLHTVNVNATCNWYGTALAASIAPQITGNVTFSPWLIDGADNSTDFGFQSSTTCPVANSYYVNDNNTTGDVFTTAVGNDANSGTFNAPYATLNYALTQVPAGATIFVDAGTYVTPDVIIDKSITIQGTNYLINPNDKTNPLLPNAARNSEAIISGSTLTIGANNINIEGLTLDPGNKSQVVLSSASFSNFNFKKNKLIIGTGTLISLVGPSTTDAELLTASDYLFADNRFEKLAVGNGITLSLAYIKNFSIHNNAFVITGPASRNQIPIIVGNGFASVVDNLSVTNNVIDRHNYNLFSYSIVRMTITGNKFYNARSGLFIQANYPGSTDIRIEDNLIEHNLPGVPVLDIMPCRIFGSTSGNSNISIRNNTINIDGTGLTSLPPAISPLFAATVANPSLVVSGNRISHTGSYNLFPQGVTGIGLVGKNFNSTVENNEVVFNGQNIIVSFVHSGISTGTDGVNGMPASSVLNFRNNKVSGYKQSITFYDRTASAADPYVGYGNLPIGATVNINNNSFTGDSLSINNGSVGQPVLATCNWYGSADAAAVIPKLTANVNYSPWLTNGTDNDVATGFQPMANVCNGRQNKFYVNDADITGDVFTTGVGNDANSGIPSAPLATLQEAINRAQNGDEIYVDAGTYVENVIVNKSVTLLGAKYGQNPGSSTDRGGESIILPATQDLGGSIIQPTANSITIDGFLLNGDNPALSGGTLVNGVDVNIGYGIFNNNVVVQSLTVKNNVVKNVQIYGIGLFRIFGNQTGPAVSGNLFTQNRVDNASRGIVFAYNAFGDITNNYISRCSGSGTWFSQQRVANVNNAPSFVSGNIIINCNLGMQSSSVQTPASMIYYLNNELSNNTTSNFAGISLIGVGNASGFVAANNKISGFARGVTINASNATVPVSLNNNSITNFINFAIEVFSSNPINATCNWYGSAAVQDFYAKLSLAADLEILPWLTNGTDNDVATGFQPVPDACDGYPTLITLNSSTNVTCNGAANGSIDITTSYGKAPFTYTWTKKGDANFVSNSEDLTGLAPGTYTLLILDGNGSNIYITDPEANGPGTITVTIIEPDVLTASLSGNNNVCFNGTIGTASALPAGGTAPYTYVWKNGATTEEISNLAAGIYDVTVTDANGCTTIASYEVTQPTQVTASITNSSSACSNIATVAAEGGTPGYTYLWSNGATSVTISGVPVGLYDVTVTDANGCTATASVTLTVSEAFNPSASVTNITCFGANDGIITATNVNGTAPFMFSKDGGISFVNGSLPFSFTNLAPGTYNIAVKDANGCVGFVEKTITQPTPINVTNTVQSTCYGESTGAVNVTVSGGTPAYSYSWTGLNGAFSSSQLNISGLAAGSYTLTVTDKNNCTTSIPVVVPSIAAIIVTETLNNVTCRGAANGSITVGASGGTNSPDPAFSYLWNTGATTTTISNLAPGNYSVRITDNGSGCFVNKSYTITQPALVLSLATAKTNATGCNSLGTITATGSGGTAPYTYSVNGEAMIGNSKDGLYGGDYTVTVTDANGCATSKLVTITDNGSDEYEGNNSKNQAKAIVVGTTINARLALSNDAADWFTFTAPGSTTGLYSIKITHPTAAYTVAVFASGKNTTALVPVSVISGSESHYQLTAGATYFVSITTTTLSYICYNFSVSALEPIEGAANRTESKIVAAPTVEILKAFTYPNPHNGNFTLSIESPEEGVATVEMYTVNGQKLSERKANLVKGKGNTVMYSNMNYAILFYKVRIGKHVVTGKIISPN